jgi:hypothetical protein
MEGIDWSSLISAAIGGVTALAGVLITQRSERKKAHADRVWKERSACYMRLYSWSSAWREYFMEAGAYCHLMMMDPDLDLKDQPQGLLAEEDFPMIFVYSSRDVEDAFTAARNRIQFAKVALRGRDDDYAQKLVAAQNSLMNLQRIISVEIKTGRRVGVIRRAAASAAYED